jgi:hypothetical protein
MRLVYIAFVCVALLSAACSTTTDGLAVKDTNDSKKPTVDITKLDVGSYPTTPSPPLGVAGDPIRGALVEAQRMSENVIGPWEVDAALTQSTGGATAIVTPADLVKIDAEPFAAAAGRHGFVNGYTSPRRADHKNLVNAVLRFADPGSASAASVEFGDIAAKTGRGVRRIPIPGHPDTLAATYTESQDSKQQWTAVRAFTAHGPYVFMQVAYADDGLESAVGLVADTIDLQGPAIDEFRATDPSEFADISLDPTGLLARTLPLPADEATPRDNITLERRGALHLQRDALLAAALFNESGMDLMANGRTVVYQTRDVEGATVIVDGFYGEVQAESESAEPVKNLPDSRCVEFSPSWFYCLGVADRYAIETSSDSLLDAQQQVAAQYVMLFSD